MSEPKTIEQWLSEITGRSLEQKTPRDRLILFSGFEFDQRGPGGRVFAATYSRAAVGPNSLGFVSLYETPIARDFYRAGIDHKRTSNFTREERADLWRAASRELCRHASGNVTVLLKQNADRDGTFFRDELPILMRQDTRVTKINGIPIEQLRGRSFEHTRAALSASAPRIELSNLALEERLQREQERGRHFPTPPRDNSLAQSVLARLQRQQELDRKLDHDKTWERDL